MSIPQGWFLSLTPEEQRFAIECIRKRLALELKARGVKNIDKIRFILVVGEAKDENGQPKTVVAFGLKREKAGSVTPEGGAEVIGGQIGGENPPQDKGVLFLDIVDGRKGLSASLSYGRHSGLHLSLAGSDEDRKWSLSISPQGWKISFDVKEGNLSLGTSISQNGTVSASVGFPMDDSQVKIGLSLSQNGLRLSFGGENPNGTGTLISWLPGNGLLGAEFYGQVGNLKIKIGMDSTGRVSINFLPSEEG
jgi:hypothetical protein